MKSFYYFCPIRKTLLYLGSKELCLQIKAPEVLIPKSMYVIRVKATFVMELEEHRYTVQYKAQWTKFISCRVKYCLQLPPYNTINLEIDLAH